MKMLSRVGGSAFGTIRVLPLSLWLVLGSSHGPPALSAAQSKDEGPYRISVDVSLVVLHATVTDRRGHFVSGLQRGDYQVYDNGVVQHIQLFRHEDVPVTVGLVVDHSGSMKPKLRDVIAAADTFARASNPDDQMFVVNFNERVSLGLPANVRFVGDASELERAIAEAAANGRTALYDAIIESLQLLKEGTRDKKVIIVISDGGDNASRHKLPQVMRMAEESNAIIYAIGLFDENDPDSNPKVLESLARATGGEAFFPTEANGVVGICEQIAKDIRNQYTLGYTPTPAPTKSAYRTIRVVASAPHHGRLFVRTRAGYLPSGNRPADGQTPGGTANEIRHQ
jgi:Ca-activated chloride channel family protein